MGASISVSHNASTDFEHLNSFRDENVGPVDILVNKNTKELLIRKKFNNFEFISSRSYIPIILERIQNCSKYVQKLLELKIDPVTSREILANNGYISKDFNKNNLIESIYEFSNQNILSILEKCIKSRVYYPEDKIWGLVNYLVRTGSLLEINLEHHPNITMKNILIINDEFKLVNPYIYDSYVVEVEKFYMKPLKDIEETFKNHADFNLGRFTKDEKYRKSLLNDVKKSKNNALDSMLKIHKERIQSNVIQMAYVILGLGNLIIDEEFLRPENQSDSHEANKSEKDRKQKFLLSQLNQFKSVYSEKLYRLIKKLLYRNQYYDVPSFLDLHREYLPNEAKDKLVRESKSVFQINEAGYKLSNLYGTRQLKSHERTISDNTYKVTTSSGRGGNSNYTQESFDDKRARNIIQTKNPNPNILQTTLKSNLSNTGNQRSARQDGRLVNVRASDYSPNNDSNVRRSQDPKQYEYLNNNGKIQIKASNDHNLSTPKNDYINMSTRHNLANTS